MKENLCLSCRESGFSDCYFRQKAEEIAASVPEDCDLAEVYDAHNAITHQRINARLKECPFINEIDPDYPGKNRL